MSQLAGCCSPSRSPQPRPQSHPAEWTSTNAPTHWKWVPQRTGGHISFQLTSTLQENEAAKKEMATTCLCTQHRVGCQETILKDFNLSYCCVISKISSILAHVTFSANIHLYEFIWHREMLKTIIIMLLLQQTLNASHYVISVSGRLTSPSLPLFPSLSSLTQS